jgi:hypothetical protein
VVDVEPLPLEIVCPGAMVEVAGQSGVEIGQIERVGTARIWTQGTAELSGVEERSESALSLTAGSEEQSTSLLSAIQTQVVDRQRAAGLMAGYCEQPLSSGWFVSGDGGVGRESVLIVNNPNDVDTQLLLEFHFAGKVLTERLVLAPNADRLISLAALVGVEPQYALYFESGGGPLSVAMQHRYSDGLTPLGVSLTTSVRPASTLQFIAPLDVLAEGFEKPRMRLFAPRDAAQVQVYAASRLLTSVALASGELKEVELELGEGVYALRIESDEVVLAQVLNPSLAPLDYSWLSPLESVTEISMPLSNFNQEIALLNPNETSIDVEIITRSEVGVERSSLALTAGQLVMLPATGISFTARSDETFMLSLRVLDERGYEVINPSENENLGRSLSVLVR